MRDTKRPICGPRRALHGAYTFNCNVFGTGGNIEKDVPWSSFDRLVGYRNPPARSAVATS